MIITMDNFFNIGLYEKILFLSLLVTVKLTIKTNYWNIFGICIKTPNIASVICKYEIFNLEQTNAISSNKC